MSPEMPQGRRLVSGSLLAKQAPSCDLDSNLRPSEMIIAPHILFALRGLLTLLRRSSPCTPSDRTGPVARSQVQSGVHGLQPRDDA
jgi:hypothetical protein